MEAKEKAKAKAKELYEKYDFRWDLSPTEIKQCALIAVDEIIKNNPHKIIEKFYVDSGGNKTDDNFFQMVSNEFYWQEVKQEILKL